MGTNDKTEVAFAELKLMREKKLKGKITIHLDGSGDVVVVQVEYFK